MTQPTESSSEAGEPAAAVTRIANQPPNEIVKVAVDQLDFDAENPRLPPTQVRDFNSILEWMLRDGSVLDLMGSIGAQGYFPGEPLLVVSKADRYTVVEGNRRFAALWLLQHPERAPARKAAVREAATVATDRPDEVPVLVFGHRDDILNYLGYRHVTGIREWGPLEKARYVRQLKARMAASGAPIDHNELARRIGSRSDYVRRLLDGLAVLEHASEQRFYDLDVEEGSINFSILTTALGFNKIAEFVNLRPTDRDSDYTLLELNDENLRDLFTWMFVQKSGGGTVLGESRQLAVLAKVLDQPQALSELREGVSLVAASTWTDAPQEQFTQLLFEARGRLQRAVQRVPSLATAADRDLAILAEINQVVADLRTLIRSRADESS